MQVRFGDYVLDIDRRELTRGPAMISIGPQVFDLLVYLVQNRERVASKDDILEAVWGGRIVSESTLTSHINAVRKAVGDSGKEQNLIRTIARKGFRFVGEVREKPAGVSSPHVFGVTGEPVAKTVRALALPTSRRLRSYPSRT